MLRLAASGAVGVGISTTVGGGVAGASATPGVSQGMAGSAKLSGDVRRVIVFHLDSLHHEAPERLGLENFQRVAERGTRVAEALTISPWHPTVSGFWPLSTTSFPNPTTFAGSVFLRPWRQQRYLQHSFAGYTAHIANSDAYRSLNPGFDFVRLHDDDSDEDNVRLGLRQLRQHEDLAFMRLLLQDTNAVSQEVANAPAGVPWARDIYGNGSPYPDAVRNADRLLGTFLDGLERLGMAEDTLLVVLADGQSRHGWHPVQAEDSWRIPLVFAGPGVAKGRTVPYAENIDIAPTIAALAGVAGPTDDGGSGRVLDEIRTTGGLANGVPRRVERINRQIVEYLRVEGWMRAHAREYPYLDVRLMAAHNGLVTDAQFWSLDRIDEWPQAGSLDRMIEDNQYALDLLHQALQESGAPPLPGGRG
ncbi:sulfatase [Kibdelosporangium aridum]|uniref:Sulfatase n=1 Tax=Kibdelosporangium aridum TaxID=2030 RepID=A0A428ZC59_KIBAR|nr:sulfatase-like hydrolase/transferase [Kibdelosporangium aridum]RSM85667.1 sulfatase [Kibdelosporangium aridum]